MQRFKAPTPEAPPPPDENQQFLQDMAAAGSPLSSMQGFELENPTEAQPFPPAPEADAISGGDWKANIPLAPGGNEAPPPVPHGVPLTDDQRAQMFAASSPEDQAKSIYAHEEAARTEEAKRRAQANLQDEQAALENHHTLKVAQEAAAARTAKLDADAAAEAKKEVGPRDRSTLQTIAGFVAAALGGLMAGKNGGPNQALVMMNQTLEREIQQSQANKNARLQDLARRGASNQQLLAQASSDHEESERWRLSMLKRAEEGIATDMQQFDPRGKAAIERGQLLVGIRQQRAKAIQDFQDKNFKDYVNAETEARAQQKAQDEHAKSLLEQAKMRGALGGGTGAAKEIDPQDVIHSPDDFVALGLPRPPGAMSRNAYENWQKLKKGANEMTAGESSLSKEEIEHAVPGITTADGKPYLANGASDNAVNLSKKVAATKTLIRLMDEAVAIRTGWTSDLAKSDEWRQLQANWAAAIGVAKDVLGLGALSGPDMDLTLNYLGAKDPTAFQDPTAGIKKARANIIGMTRDALDASSLRGKTKFDIPYIEPAKPKATAADTAQKNALHAPSGTDVFDAVMPSRAKDPFEIANEVENGKAKEVPAVADSIRETGIVGDVPKIDRDHIDSLEVQLDSGNKAESEQAGEMLRALAGAGKGPTAQYARDVLQRHVLSNAQSAVDASMAPKTATVREEAPPRPPTEPNKKKGR
jgi:hypothetical protein